MIDKTKIYAVVGSSSDARKYGYKVLQALSDAGYKVFPINPKGGEILGLTAYSKLSEVPEQIDVAIFVVSPPVGQQIMPEVKELGIGKVWLQPGSESQKIMDFCSENGIDCVSNAGIIIEKNKHK